MTDLPHPLVDWRAFTGRLAGRRPALFLDYDGTLAPIAPLPELALLPAATRRVLGRLAAAIPVVIVSGRGRDDVARLVGLDGLTYAGSHGFDLAGPGGRPLPPPPSAGIGEHLRERIDRVTAELRDALAGTPGLLVEPKGFSVAVHFRLTAPELVPGVEAVVDAAVARHAGLRKAGGKRVFEIRPDLDWDKGRAVLFLLDALGLDRPDVLPLYLGDDETDEDAFRALAGRGLGILVAAEPRPTAAEYRLDDPGQVREFLARLLARVEAGG